MGKQAVAGFWSLSQVLLEHEMRGAFPPAQNSPATQLSQLGGVVEVPGAT